MRSQSERKTNQIWTVNAIKKYYYSRVEHGNEVWFFLHHRFQFSRSRRKVHISHQSDELKEQLLKEVKCSVRIYFICTKVKHAWNLVGSLSPGRVIRHTYELMEIAHVEIHRPSELVRCNFFLRMKSNDNAMVKMPVNPFEFQWM